MSKIDKFLAKPMEVKLLGESHMVTPFTIDDFPMLTRMGDKDPLVKSAAIKESIFKFLLQIDDTITSEEVGKISMGSLEEIMDAIASVNDIDMSDAKSELIKELKDGH